MTDPSETELCAPPLNMAAPCRRCEHSYDYHAPMGECQVEFTTSSVPSLDLGSRCPCAGFVYEPATEERPAPEKPEALDGPAMYAQGSGFLRLARQTTDEYFERHMLEHASAYFVGATAAAMAAIVVANGTGDIIERRWLAALAGDKLPQEDA